MGVYNTILVPCPECGNEVEFQTKSGDCSLTTYSILCAPYEEVKGIMGRNNYCRECNTEVTIGRDPRDFSHLVDSI